MRMSYNGVTGNFFWITHDFDFERNILSTFPAGRVEPLTSHVLYYKPEYFNKQFPDTL